MEFLPKEVRDGLDAARKKQARTKGRMKIRVGDEEFVILRYWDKGFAVDAEDAAHVRGLVNLYDGGRHLSQCLVVASEADETEATFEVKRETRATDVPPVDYERDVPVALIGKA